MKLWILSDLHQEFAQLAWQPDVVPEHDVLVLAGDIHCGIENSIRWAEGITNKPILMVLGNHEFYGRDMEYDLIEARNVSKVLNGVRILENRSQVIGDIRFIGATLWTDFLLWGEEERAICEIEATKLMNDFKVIRFNPYWSKGLKEGKNIKRAGPPEFRTEDSIELHHQSRTFIEAELAKLHQGPTVVITHHAPHPNLFAINS